MARYSYSKLGAYRTCPLQYRFRYIDKMPVEVGPSIEAFMGSRVHDALEWLYRQVAGAQVPTIDEILATYDERWETERPEDLRIVNEELDEPAYREVGRQCLERYVERYTPFGNGLILGLEDRFEIRLGSGLVLNGVIDRLMKASDGTYEVHDYKTSQHLPTPEQAKTDEQGSWYALAVQRRFPQAGPVRLVWHYLRHDEERVSTRTIEETKALESDIVQRVRDIESALEFPAVESRLCAWCDYCSICPAKGHRRALEALQENEYLQEPGFALVNRLAQLRSSLRATTAEAESEIAKVEEALIAYAREHGYTVVVGDTHEATISESRVLSFPRKGDPEREPLESLVRELGLWDAVSDLSLSKLGAEMRTEALPSDARARLDPYAGVETRVAIRLRKRCEEL